MVGVRVVGIAALVVHVVLGLVSLVLLLGAFGWQVAAFLDPPALVDAGTGRANLLRWGAAADLLSYYLPIPVVAYVLWRTLRHRSPVVADLSFLAACGYAVAGGAAAATLSVVGPQLMESYAAPDADRAALSVVFAALMGAVYAVWQFLDPLLLGAWWIGVGLLVRSEHRGFGILSLCLGAVTGSGALLNVLGLRGPLTALLGVVFAAWLVWSVWLLILLVRRRPPFDQRVDHQMRTRSSGAR